MITQLKSFDKKFLQTDFLGDTAASDTFTYNEHHSLVCFCAPHATKSFVCNKVKQSDLYTGAIVEFLGEFYGYSYITRNKFTPRKELISDFIFQNNQEHHIFLDIHGMKNNNIFDLAVGTGYLSAKEYTKEIQQIHLLAKKYNLSVTINHPSYRGNIGLAGRLQKADSSIKALQLEWSKTYRDFYNCPDIVCQKTIPFLKDLAEWLEHTEKKEL